MARKHVTTGGNSQLEPCCPMQPCTTASNALSTEKEYVRQARLAWTVRSWPDCDRLCYLLADVHLVHRHAAPASVQLGQQYDFLLPLDFMADREKAVEHHFRDKVGFEERRPAKIACAHERGSQAGHHAA